MNPLWGRFIGSSLQVQITAGICLISVPSKPAKNNYQRYRFRICISSTESR